MSVRNPCEVHRSMWSPWPGFNGRSLRQYMKILIGIKAPIREGRLRLIGRVSQFAKRIDDLIGIHGPVIFDRNHMIDRVSQALVEHAAKPPENAGCQISVTVDQLEEMMPAPYEHV